MQRQSERNRSHRVWSKRESSEAFSIHWFDSCGMVSWRNCYCTQCERFDSLRCEHQRNGVDAAVEGGGKGRFEFQAISRKSFACSTAVRERFESDDSDCSVQHALWIIARCQVASACWSATASGSRARWRAKCFQSCCLHHQRESDL